MNIVFYHPSGLGQFQYLAEHLAKDPGRNIVFLCRKRQADLPEGVRLRQYTGEGKAASPFDKYLREAEGVYHALKALEETESFIPDIIMGHTGWGGLLYVRAACPKARVIGYFEWYHRMTPEYKDAWFLYRTPEEINVIITQQNAGLLAELELCDVRLTPTEWQRSIFPGAYRPHMRVIHEGIDTDYFCPGTGDESAALAWLPGLAGAREIITYVSRGLEPTRCFPLFMDSIRLVLSARPHCHVVIAGNEKNSYGSPLPEGRSWKQQELEKGGFDPRRVHFTGWISREKLLGLFRASTVHVYLTLPFVLSWSVLQAMSAGCCIAASATPPVEEAIEDGKNGLLIYDMTPEGIAGKLKEVLDDEALRRRLGRAARATILSKYSLKDSLRLQKQLLFSDQRNSFPVIDCN